MGAVMAGPRNDLQRLPMGFDSPRLHTFPPGRQRSWPGNRLPGQPHKRRPRPGQEYAMCYAVALG